MIISILIFKEWGCEVDIDNAKLADLADDVLTQFQKIAAKASASLKDDAPVTPTSFAKMNTFTSEKTIKTIDEVNTSKSTSLRKLIKEPAIARIIVVDEENRPQTYYICRTSPVSNIPDIKLASYKGPIGRLASLGVGSEFTLPNGKTVEVTERSQLNPSLLSGRWDSHNTIIESEIIEMITVESLRSLIEGAKILSDPEDILGQLLSEEKKSENIITGRRRNVITKMGLRDQPILDEYQDEIFRLPINRSLLILGPPGTGKTTTLIRRLGQKIDPVFLDEHEQQLITKVEEYSKTPHKDSWLMFTPTELLKQYLKEAFSREGVPAPDSRIRTWHDYRRELARLVFNILRTSSGNGPFILKDDVIPFNQDAIAQPIAWYSDFLNWQQNTFFKDLSEASYYLSQLEENDLNNIGTKISSILEKYQGKQASIILIALVKELPSIQKNLQKRKEKSDASINKFLNLQLNKNRSFLDNLASYLDDVQLLAATEDLDELEDDQEEDHTVQKTGRAGAYTTYLQTIRALARAKAARRSIKIDSRYGKILKQLGTCVPSEEELITIGKNLLVQSKLRKFMNPVKRYIGQLPTRYRSFRRIRRKEGAWYSNINVTPREIHSLEVDAILLSILNEAGEFLKKDHIIRNINDSVWASLKPVLDTYKSQIIVDEVTDFSPIQIACMAALTHPYIRSFFACGDFNQRLTTWGTKTDAEMKWALPNFEIREITISYRQSKQLNALARSIALASGEDQTNVQLPEKVDNEGVRPVMLEHASDVELVSQWLADRICEIEQSVKQLPSTAIFVNSEDEISPLATMLNDKLTEQNIQVVPCPNGQVIGSDNDIRVFDIQYIKGLEFEAVFFIGVDQLKEMHPDLFSKYLYVGVTRAATFLGITSQGGLPTPIDALRDQFGNDWAND